MNSFYPLALKKEFSKRVEYTQTSPMWRIVGAYPTIGIGWIKFYTYDSVNNFSGTAIVVNVKKIRQWLGSSV